MEIFARKKQINEILDVVEESQLKELVNKCLWFIEETESTGFLSFEFDKEENEVILCYGLDSDDISDYFSSDEIPESVCLSFFVGDEDDETMFWYGTDWEKFE